MSNDVMMSSSPSEEPTCTPPYAEEIKLIKQYVNKDSVCLDIGANIGSYTVFLASIASQVLAFEPSSNNYKELEQNTQNLDNVSLFNLAVSDKNDELTDLYLCPTDKGMNRLYKSKWCEDGKIEKVRTTTIDYLAPHNYILLEYGVNFIKIDVEGYEYHVIKGMQRTIQRDHPVIMMEFHPPTLEEAGTDPRELYEFMFKFSYGDPIHVLLNKDINSYEELFNYTNDIPAINVLWVPKK